MPYSDGTGTLGTGPRPGRGLGWNAGGEKWERRNHGHGRRGPW